MERFGADRLVVAAAGYGKTTALRQWYAGEVHWFCGKDAPAALAEAAVDRADDTARQLVLDDLPQLDPDAARALWDAIARLPAATHVAMSSRWPLPPGAGNGGGVLGGGFGTGRGGGVGLGFSAGGEGRDGAGRDGARGYSAAGEGMGRGGTGIGGAAGVVRVRPCDLALPVERVAELLASEYELREPLLAERLREVSGGWPALVWLAAEAIASGGSPHLDQAADLAEALAEPRGVLAEYIQDEVLGPLPEEARRLIREAGELVPVTVGLCAALGHRRAAEMVRLLGPVGILGAGPTGAAGIVPLVAAVARHGAGAAPARVIVMAARWYERHGPPRAAARAYRLAGDAEQAARVLAAHGSRMIVTGSPRAVADLIGWLPERLRSRRLRLLLGDALRTAGDAAAAAHAYQAVAAGEAEWDAGLAWRVGLIHYLRGDQTAALAAYDKATRPGAPPDEALLLAWRAVATARHGDAVAGTTFAWRAYHLAAETGDDDALATAHTSLALCLGLTGDQVGSAEHYAAALRIAERVGDLVLLARILTNQSFHLIEEARYPEALAVSGRAAGCAESAGHANLHAMSTENEAFVLTQFGRYDEAVERYGRVLSRYRGMGTRYTASALVGIGEVHLLRGCREQARGAFQEALAVADGGQARVWEVRALAGLARLALPDDPDAAARFADEAALRSSDHTAVPALVAQGWVAVARDDRAAALALAADLIRRAPRAGLAQALELRAAAETEPAKARAALREAHAIWAEAGAVGNVARVLAALSRLPGATGEDRIAALLSAWGVTGADAGTDEPDGRGAGVSIRVLGRFEVLLDGRPVPPAAWQSRRARDLLRILVARRGRPVPRPELSELLWPDDDPARTGHRLSVLLSIVRGVLDPDKTFAPDHYLVTDAASVALDVKRMRVDVTEFLTAVGHGRRLLERGSPAEARTVLTAAERDYRGDVFADEPYSDWAGPLREQARAAYLGALRMLASASRAANEPEAAVHHLLRLLESDPYDEPAHRALVRTLVSGGRHGEARRAFERYRVAMREIGVRAPDADVLAPRRPVPAGATANA